MEATHYTKADLKARGWTESLIRKFAPDPDTTKRNWRFPKAAAVCLYRANRIEEIEQVDEFKSVQQRAQVRSANAKARARTKKMEAHRQRTAEAEQWLQTMPKPVLPLMEWDRLSEKAVAHRNLRDREFAEHRAAMSGEYVDDMPITGDAPESVLHRLAVNYLRHKHTAYDKVMRRQCDIYRKAAYRDMVLSVIADAYPYLSEECDRQKSVLWKPEGFLL